MSNRPTLADVFANLDSLKDQLEKNNNPSLDMTDEEVEEIFADDSSLSDALDATPITVTEGMNPDRWGPNGEDLFATAPKGWDVAETDVEDDPAPGDDVDDDEGANTWTHVSDAAAPQVRKTLSVKGLNEKAVLVQLKRSMYSPYKLDEAESRAYGAGNVNKHLFEGRDNRVRQTISKFTDVYTFFNDNTVPWAKGVRMLNIDHYFAFTTQLRKYIDAALAAADDLAANWQFEVNQDLARLSAIAQTKGKPNLANPADYPTRAEIRQRFDIEVRYMPVPTAGDFRVQISDEDKASLQKQLEDAENDAARHVIEEMIGPMQRAVEKLNVPIGQDGAIFRDSLIDNIVEVADRMGRINVSDDPSITEKIAALKSLASTYANNKDVLRSMPDVRKKAATQISDLVSQMSGLV